MEQVSEFHIVGADLPNFIMSDLFVSRAAAARVVMMAEDGLPMFSSSHSS